MNAHYIAILAKLPTRSAWQRGVKAYAADLLQTMDENGAPMPGEAAMLGGARDWRQWAEGGCGLVYDRDIAERLCSPSELKRVRGGDRNPSRGQTWLDVEARAAYQASRAILQATRGAYA